MKAELVQVIRSEHQRGRGTRDNPLRTVIAWHRPDGTLIAEEDPQRVFDESDELANTRQALLAEGIAVGELQTALEQAIYMVKKHNDSASAVTGAVLIAEWQSALDRSRSRHRSYAIGVPPTPPPGG